MWWKFASQAAQNALGTINTYYNTKLQNQSLKYQAAAARNNAKLATMQSESSLRHGERASQQIMTAAAKQKGAQKTGYAANGVDISSRSAQNIMNETDYQAQSDQIQTEANALANAWSYRLQATNYNNQAKIAKSKMQSPLGAAITYSIGKFLSDMGGSGFDDMFGKNKQEDNIPAPDAPRTTSADYAESLSPTAMATAYAYKGSILTGANPSGMAANSSSNYYQSWKSQYNPQYWNF